MRSVTAPLAVIGVGVGLALGLANTTSGWKSVGIPIIAFAVGFAALVVVLGRQRKEELTKSARWLRLLVLFSLVPLGLFFPFVMRHGQVSTPRILWTCAAVIWLFLIVELVGRRTAQHK